MSILDFAVGAQGHFKQMLRKTCQIRIDSKHHAKNYGFFISSWIIFLTIPSPMKKKHKGKQIPFIPGLIAFSGLPFVLYGSQAAHAAFILPSAILKFD